MDGVLIINKPAGWTSHDVVARVRKVLRTKVGHAGTLDPQATGVLPLLIGRVTRLMRFLVQHNKVYLARVRFGVETDTYDADGRIVRENPVPPCSREAAEELLARFTGRQDQVPPMYSALRVDGERLYKAARRGDIKVRPARPIEIFKLELVDFSDQAWTLRVECSAGTYIRSLAHDLGQCRGCGGHLESLCRERVGEFDLNQAVSIDAERQQWERALIEPERLLTDLPRKDVEPAHWKLLRNGNPLPGKGLPEGSFVRLFLDGSLFAIGQAQGSLLQPVVVIGKTG